MKPAIQMILDSGVTEGKSLVLVVTAVEAINPRFEGTSFEANCFLVREFGDPSAYTGPFRAIALSKAEISARTGLPTTKVAPQYLLDGDTVNSGSAVIDGIVVAGSGDKGYWDEAFSYMCAAVIQALCKKRFAELKADDTINFVP